jgi:hypothetical protein
MVTYTNRSSIAYGLSGQSAAAVWTMAFTVLAAGAAVTASTQMLPETSQLPALQDPPLTQYRALRRMHARNEKFNQEAWVDAWTELNGQTFRYEITSERGSEYIRTKILKALLTHEQDLVEKGEAARADISADNYQFEESDASSGDVRYVLLKPKRKDMLLLNGRLVMNTQGTELLRVEGTMSKNPSFWTSLVSVVREFARLDGVRVPVSTATVAKLKFAGQAQLDVRYEYETVNGRPVGMASAAGVYRPGTH